MYSSRNFLRNLADVTPSEVDAWLYTVSSRCPQFREEVLRGILDQAGVGIFTAIELGSHIKPKDSDFHKAVWGAYVSIHG